MVTDVIKWHWGQPASKCQIQDYQNTDRLSVCRMLLLQRKSKLCRTKPSAWPRVGHSCSKHFRTTRGCQKKPFAANMADPLCAKDTRHLIRFARNGSIQRSPQPWHRLSLKFGIFICDRNSNTCSKIRARMNLLKRDKKLDRFSSSLCIVTAQTVKVKTEYTQNPEHVQRDSPGTN